MSAPHTDLQKHQYYGALMSYYIRNILESGLLLDEDLEVLLNLYHLDNPPEKKTYRPSFKLLASLSSVLVSLPVAKKVNSKLIVLPAVFISLAVIALEMKSIKDKNNQRILIHSLIDTLKKIHSLDASITRHMKTRQEIGRRGEEMSSALNNRGIEEFLNTTVQSELKIFEHCMNLLNKISCLSDELADDFLRIEDFKPLGTELKSPVDVNECVALTTRIQDLHTWLSSKILSYIGVLFLFSSGKLSDHTLEELLTVEIPKTVFHLQHHHDSRKKHFDSLRYSAKKWTEYRIRKRENPDRLIPVKLQKTLESVVDNLSLISEKSMRILEEIERNESNVSSGVNIALIDLKNHAFSAYESLDLLCRLYGILSNTKETKIPNGEALLPTKKIENENIALVHYDDRTEPEEENFELYLDAEDVAEEQPNRSHEDHSGEYLGLMLQELKQSLRQHERFIQAKKKRGSQEEGEEEIERRPKTPPRFNLKVLNDVSGENEPEAEEGGAVIDSACGPSETSMPPPPPLPMFDLRELEEDPRSIFNPKSMLDNIRALSGQLSGQEEVYSISD